MRLGILAVFVSFVCAVQPAHADVLTVNGTLTVTSGSKTESYDSGTVSTGTGPKLVKGTLRIGYLKTNSESCSAGTECESGSCSSGVCCNSACNGGCGSCTLAGSVGTCSPLAMGTECRASTGVCDRAEVCDGSSVSCPSNNLLPAGSVCREKQGLCDRAEVCNGTSAGCPADTYEPSGTVCRGSRGSCDFAETCSGGSPSCPADAVAAAGTGCSLEGTTCMGDTRCDGRGMCTEYIDDSMGCNGAECQYCGDGTCSGGESCSSCAADCGACPYCGDGSCNNGETCASCSTDCGACPYCGDGICNNGETESTCYEDCGSGGSCFPAGTPIRMADGSEKAIEEVRAGDRVLAYDELTGRVVPSEVVRTFVHAYRGDLVRINDRVEATTNHPIWSGGEWFRADQLAPGDQLISLPGAGDAISSLHAVQTLSRRAIDGTVYNFEVANQHTYFAAGVLVHNKPIIPE